MYSKPIIKVDNIASYFKKYPQIIHPTTVLGAKIYKTASCILYGNCTNLLAHLFLGPVLFGKVVEELDAVHLDVLLHGVPQLHRLGKVGVVHGLNEGQMPF